ncbi:MHS family MFS transporter [Streptomyces sp. DASNCL29]|nr:MFS transporter [Streptomyces sp. DASNCL29]TMU98701.1 MHS family MFS transporter [Streptomyces sp. DASNCL29]
MTTFAVSYAARPLGAVLLGHVGDRFGRKRVLVTILVLMGTCTFLVGCLPAYSTIGVWAPVLLVTLRVLQGISVGGETAAVTVLTIEVAPPHRRAFFTSWSSNGIVGGFVLATLVFIPVAALPDERLYAWGWRIPFLLSALVATAGFIIRAKLAESEAFVEAREENALVRVPVLEVFRSHWGAVLRVVLCSLAFAIDTVIKVFALSFATTEYGIAESTMLWVLIVSHLGALVTQPLIASLADRIGRKPVFIAGNLGCAATLFAYFAAIQARETPLLMFHLKVRQTGMALGLQIGLIAAGFAPSVYLALTAGDPGNWLPVAIISAVVAVAAALSAVTAKETAFTPLDQLGEPIAHTTAPDTAAGPRTGAPSINNLMGRGRRVDDP